MMLLATQGSALTATVIKMFAAGEEKSLTLVCFTAVLVECLCFLLISDAYGHQGLKKPAMAVSQLPQHCFLTNRDAVMT